MILAAKQSEFDWIQEGSLPVLVLGMTVSDYDFKKEQAYDFKEDRNWQLISHQTAGVGCHHHYFWGSVLTPKPGILEKMKLLCDAYLDTNMGIFGTPGLGSLVEYSGRLKTLFGVDCDDSYRLFEEGIYPIDCTEENLAKLCEDKLPSDLDELINWPAEGWLKACGCFGRWKLVILGENCD